MKRIAYLFGWLELLGLSLWVGGMITVGALVAPIIFDYVKPIEMAGDAMSMIFRRFNGGVVYGCIILVVIGFTGKFFLMTRSRSRWIEGGLLLFMVLMGVYIGAVLGPRMQDLREIRLSDPSNTGAVVEFDRGHRFSERLFTFNLILGIAVLFMNAREIVSSKGNKDDTSPSS